MSVSRRSRVAFDTCPGRWQNWAFSRQYAGWGLCGRAVSIGLPVTQRAKLSLTPMQNRDTTPFPFALVGRSAAAEAGRAAFLAALRRRTPVLITAEAGCRAVELAQRLHEQAHAAAPVEAVDCGAGGSRELERVLFGSPSSNGASHPLETVSADCAVVRLAAGTLVLENVDQLPASTQRRLARVMRDAEVRVPRSRMPVVTDFRLIAITSLDLQGEARDGRFRLDLLRRLAACRIDVLPLRQRSADIGDILEALPLAHAELSPPAITVLTSLPWPGNIDELLEFVDALDHNSAPGQMVTAEDVLRHLPMQGSLARLDLTAGLREARRRFERDYIAAVLERHRWSMSDAARTLGIERANLYRKTRQLGIARGSREPWTAHR